MFGEPMLHLGSYLHGGAELGVPKHWRPIQASRA